MHALALLALASLSNPNLRMPVLGSAEPVGDRPVVTVDLDWNGQLSRGDRILARADAELGASALGALAEIAAGMEQKEMRGLPVPLANEPLRVCADAFAPASKLLDLFEVCAGPEVMIWRFELAGAPADGSHDRAQLPLRAVESLHVLSYVLPIDVGVGGLVEEPDLPRAEIRLGVQASGERVGLTDRPRGPFVYDEGRWLLWEMNGGTYPDLASLLAGVGERANGEGGVYVTLEIGEGVCVGELVRLVDGLRGLGVERPIIRRP